MKDPESGVVTNLSRYRPMLIQLDAERARRRVQKAQHRRTVVICGLVLVLAAILTARSWAKTGPVHGVFSYVLLTALMLVIAVSAWGSA